MPRLLTLRLLIRPLIPSDASAVHTYHSQPDISRYQSWAQLPRAELSQRIARFAEVPPGTPDTWYQLAIELRESKQLIGDIGLHTLADPHETEIGITLAPEHQRQGHATEALSALIHHLFTRLHIRRLLAHTHPDNTPSQALLRRLHFQAEPPPTEPPVAPDQPADLLFTLTPPA